MTALKLVRPMSILITMACKHHFFHYQIYFTSCMMAFLFSDILISDIFDDDLIHRVSDILPFWSIFDVLCLRQTFSRLSIHWTKKWLVFYFVTFSHEYMRLFEKLLSVSNKNMIIIRGNTVVRHMAGNQRLMIKGTPIWYDDYHSFMDARFIK